MTWTLGVENAATTTAMTAILLFTDPAFAVFDQLLASAVVATETNHTSQLNPTLPIEPLPLSPHCDFHKK